MRNDPQADLREAFRAVGDEFIKAFEQADRMARAACDDVRRLVSDGPAAGTAEARGGSPVEAIRGLAALRAEGLISDDEFAAKKSELLARI